jgi:Trypsin-co-occurring domain 1
MPSTQIVKYRADDGTIVTFEIDPVDGFSPASSGSAVIGQIRDAAWPAIEAAKSVLDRVKELSPDGVQVKFGIKVTGTANWLIAKSTAEGSFEVTLSWDRSTAPIAETAPAAGLAPVQPRIGE